MHCVERFQHPGWDVAVDNGRLELVAVDEHRGAERLEALDTQAVEGARADKAELVRASSYTADDLLFRVRRERADPEHHVDPDIPRRQLPDPPVEVVDLRVVPGFRVHRGHLQDDRIAGTAGL